MYWDTRNDVRFLITTTHDRCTPATSLKFPSHLSLSLVHLCISPFTPWAQGFLPHSSWQTQLHHRRSGSHGELGVVDHGIAEAVKVGNGVGRGDRSASVGALSDHDRQERQQFFDDEDASWCMGVKGKHRRLKTTYPHSLYMLAQLVLAQRFT